MVEREEGQESAFVILNHFYRSYGFHSWEQSTHDSIAF
jgi:hypothetical protein